MKPESKTSIEHVCLHKQIKTYVVTCTDIHTRKHATHVNTYVYICKGWQIAVNILN